MGQTRFALQPLLEQRKHREALRRAELAQAQRARDAVAQAVNDSQRQYDWAFVGLARSVSEGHVAGAQAYDAMLGVLDRARRRLDEEVPACDAAIATAAASLRMANRERRTLERLRERLAARHAPRCDDD